MVAVVRSERKWIVWDSNLQVLLTSRTQKVRRNVIFERARFNQRNQQQNESAEEYIAVLYNLAGNCEYGALLDEMIRDHLVVGI